MSLALDVTNAASIDAAVQAVLDRYGRIDALVNNAEYAVFGAVEELDGEAVRRMYDVNVLGVIRMVRAVTPAMRARGMGRIITIGSLEGKFPGPANGAYAGTKHALEALSDALRWELEPFGVQVVLVEPGSIRASFYETAMRGSRGVLARRDSPYAPLYARVARATREIRATEPGPEAVARVVLTALRAKRPHARYPAAIPLAARIAAALSDRGKDLVVRRLYRLGALPRPHSARPAEELARLPVRPG
jgi:NAD(P)-dependent dehydrogenase (short-subunit alcohol dehydrogenase family)